MSGAIRNATPLAVRLRPHNLNDIFGQDHILGPGMMLRRMIEADTLSSIILYGPPGTGKTTIASVIAEITNCIFQSINATTAGKADMKKVTDNASKALEEQNTRTILFIDEIHRFNKAQQDFLLPFVENGTIVLIGATTENPYFEINGALLSRSQIFELKPLDEQAMRHIVDRAITTVNQTAFFTLNIEPEAIDFFVNVADGDARQILNAIDLATRTTQLDANGNLNIDLMTAEQCIQRKVKQYDKDGDNHYDNISAFIESMKHSEVDAALYYLARMIDRGEDPKYIARRLVVCASCDIGVAYPDALNVAINAFLTVERVGLPECVYALAMSTIYNAMSPKSNTVAVAYHAALEDAQNLHNIAIPNSLRDESYKSAWKLGHGGVSDVFANPNNYDGFECMPAQLVGKQYYFPGTTGHEAIIQKYWQWCHDFKAHIGESNE